VAAPPRSGSWEAPPWSPTSLGPSPRRATSLRHKGTGTQKPRPRCAQRSPSQSFPKLTVSPDMNQKPGRETHLLSPPQAEWDEHAVEGLGPQGTESGAEGLPEGEAEGQGQEVVKGHQEAEGGAGE